MSLAIPLGMIGSSALVFEPESYVLKLEVTASQTFNLPLVNGATYSFDVDWGDGSDVDTITTWDDAAKNHLYSSAGTRYLILTGAIRFLRLFLSHPYRHPR